VLWNNFPIGRVGGQFNHYRILSEEERAGREGLLINGYYAPTDVGLYNQIKVRCCIHFKFSSVIDRQILKTYHT